LIKTLLESGQRLEELTAGEVDSIADSLGRTFLLQRAQERNMTTGPEGLALVSTIIKLAHSLKLDAVAGGVETTEQSRLLRLLHCDEMQGFLFSKPLPAATYELQYLSMESETRVAASSQY
jgi:EAL domain-containing protein (putative c-di-GMP-specific phosphodiesterase class I)